MIGLRLTKIVHNTQDLSEIATLACKLKVETKAAPFGLVADLLFLCYNTLVGGSIELVG